MHDPVCLIRTNKCQFIYFATALVWRITDWSKQFRIIFWRV